MGVERRSPFKRLFRENYIQFSEERGKEIWAHRSWRLRPPALARATKHQHGQHEVQQAHSISACKNSQKGFEVALMNVDVC